MSGTLAFGRIERRVEAFRGPEEPAGPRTVVEDLDYLEERRTRHAEILERFRNADWRPPQPEPRPYERLSDQARNAIAGRMNGLRTKRLGDASGGGYIEVDVLERQPGAPEPQIWDYAFRPSDGAFLGKAVAFSPEDLKVLVVVPLNFVLGGLEEDLRRVRFAPDNRRPVIWLANADDEVAS